MNYTIKYRKKFYNDIVERLDENTRKSLNLKENRLLGQGYQGIVHSYCDEKKCIAVKKVFLENRQAKYLKKPFSIPALKYENFIELAAMKLTNQLVLQNVCPHFILHYKSTNQSREYEPPCQDIYPYSSKFYNELIEGAKTYTDWVKEKHTTEEWYNAYFQITVSIYCLQKYLNMIHLDLHSDNILVKTVKRGGYWKYVIDGKNYYVPNYGFIFYINDFGHAWIPENFQSWIVRRKYKTKRIHKNFDIMKLFESTLEFSTSSREFKSQIRNIITELEGDTNFNHIIQSVWSQYNKKPKSKLIETYNLGKSLNKNTLPKELRHLVLH